MHTAPKEKCNPVCTKRISRVFRIGGGGTAAFHARVLGSVPGLGGLKETKMFLPHPRGKLNIVENLRDREVACSASDCQGLNCKFCVWRTVSSHSSHHPQEVLLAQFSLYVLEGGLRTDSFHFILFSFSYVGLISHTFQFELLKYNHLIALPKSKLIFMIYCEMFLFSPHTNIHLDDIARLWHSDRHVLAAWLYCDH